MSPSFLNSRDMLALERTAGMPFVVSAVDWSMDDASPQTHIGDVMVLFPRRLSVCLRRANIWLVCYVIIIPGFMCLPA